MSQEEEAVDFDFEEYKFTPEEKTENGKKILDYTGVKNNEIYLVNKKDILTKEKPSWIPDLDAEGLKADNFLPVCVCDNEGNYYVQGKTKTGEKAEYTRYGKQLRPVFEKKVYKMSLDVLAVTVDYYLKKTEAENKRDGKKEKVQLPRALNKMSIVRYDEMRDLLSYCKNYREREDSYQILYPYKIKSKDSGFKVQKYVLFNEQYTPLLQILKDKRLDLNCQKTDYISSFEKGRETAYGDSNTSNSLLNEFGIKIKKQNGTTFSSDELNRLKNAIKENWKHFGSFSELAYKYGLKVSYADNCFQYARKAIGLFSNYEKAIGVSFFNNKKNKYFGPEDVTFCHELTHWFDALKGKEYSCHFASDKTGTLENKIALTYKKELRKLKSSENLGGYYFRTCECLARAVEQDYGIKYNISSEFFKDSFLPEDVFKKEIQPLVEELIEENRKYFNLELKENTNEVNKFMENEQTNNIDKEKIKMGNTEKMDEKTEQIRKDSEFLHKTYGNKKAVDSAVKKVSIKDFVSDDPTRYIMNGIFYENGFAIATNSHILIKQKADYPSSYEGKIIDPKNGKEIEGYFPNYKNVFSDRKYLIDRSERLNNIDQYLSTAVTASNLLPKKSNLIVKVDFDNTRVNPDYLITALAYAKEKGFNKVYQEDNSKIIAKPVQDENGKDIFKYFDLNESNYKEGEYRYKYYSFDELPESVQKFISEKHKNNETGCIGYLENKGWYYDLVVKNERVLEPNDHLIKSIEFDNPDGSAILIMPNTAEEKELYFDKDGLLHNYEEELEIKVKLLGKDDDFFKNIVSQITKNNDSDLIQSFYEKNKKIAEEKQSEITFPQTKKDCQIYSALLTFADIVVNDIKKHNYEFTDEKNENDFKQNLFENYTSIFMEYPKKPALVYNFNYDFDLYLRNAKEKNIIKEITEVKENSKVTAEEAKTDKIEEPHNSISENNKIKYHYYVKDKAEFEAYAEFEPVLNLNAQEAILKLKELSEKGLNAGIGIVVEDSIDHGKEFEGEGLIEADYTDAALTFTSVFEDKRHMEDEDYIGYRAALLDLSLTAQELNIKVQNEPYGINLINHSRKSLEEMISKESVQEVSEEKLSEEAKIEISVSAEGKTNWKKLEKICSKDKDKLFMTKPYIKNGFAIATDGRSIMKLPLPAGYRNLLNETYVDIEYTKNSIVLKKNETYNKESLFPKIEKIEANFMNKVPDYTVSVNGEKIKKLYLEMKEEKGFFYEYSTGKDTKRSLYMPFVVSNGKLFASGIEVGTLEDKNYSAVFSMDLIPLSELSPKAKIEIYNDAPAIKIKDANIDFIHQTGISYELIDWNLHTGKEKDKDCELKNITSENLLKIYPDNLTKKRTAEAMQVVLDSYNKENKILVNSSSKDNILIYDKEKNNLHSISYNDIEEKIEEIRNIRKLVLGFSSREIMINGETVKIACNKFNEFYNEQKNDKTISESALKELTEIDETIYAFTDEDSLYNLNDEKLIAHLKETGIDLPEPKEEKTYSIPEKWDYTNLKEGLTEEDFKAIRTETEWKKGNEFSPLDKVKEWKEAEKISEPEIRNKILYKVYSLFEEYNLHEENKLLLERKFTELEKMYTPSFEKSSSEKAEEKNVIPEKEMEEISLKEENKVNGPKELYARTSQRGWEISVSKDFKHSFAVRPQELPDRVGFLLLEFVTDENGWDKSRAVKELLAKDGWNKRKSILEAVNLSIENKNIKDLHIINAETDKDITDEIFNGPKKETVEKPVLDVKPEEEKLEEIKPPVKEVYENKNPDLLIRVFENTEKGRINIEINSKINPEKAKIVEEKLNEAGWKYTSYYNRWYPVGKALESARQFAFAIYYDKELNDKKGKTVSRESVKKPEQDNPVNREPEKEPGSEPKYDIF